MRKIEIKMRSCVECGYNMSEQNTVVSHYKNDCFVYLHGNLIYKMENGRESFTLAGWNTNTTRSRLNALGVNVYNKNYTPYYNGAPISENKWYNV